LKRIVIWKQNNEIKLSGNRITHHTSRTSIQKWNDKQFKISGSFYQLIRISPVSEKIDYKTAMSISCDLLKNGQEAINEGDPLE